VGVPSDAQGIDQQAAPFFDAVRAYRDTGIVPFHTPGHKQGRGAPAAWAAAVGTAALGLDVSDVVAAPEWDDSWTSVLAAAEGLAARAFGADFCYFLVNGTSGGVHAMLLAQAAGRKVIVARNSHRSVIGGLVLADAMPVYVPPAYDPATGLSLPPPVEAWISAMEQHPDAAAVLVTYPTYDGAALDLKALADAAHARGVCVLVDEAHGPHFGLHPALPPRAMDAGADMSAQSPHKLLGAMTQASWLLGRAGRVRPEAVAAVLGTLQTTSPSAILLASLDVARRQAALEGEDLVRAALARAQAVRAFIAGLPGLLCLPEDCPDPEAGASDPTLRWDPTKLRIGVRGLGVSGYAAARALRGLGVQVELAGPEHVLALITLGDTDETVDALCRGLEHLARGAHGSRGGEIAGATARGPRPGVSLPPPAGRQRLRPREAALAPVRLVPLGGAAGCVAADVVCPYPPGIPVLCPGEEVSQEAVAYLQDILKQGGEVRGLAWASDGPRVLVAVGAGR